MFSFQLIKRALLMYLIEDVSISPNSRFELNLFGKNKLFVEGEESVVPRWVALILKKRNLVKVKDEVDDILGYALMLIEKQSRMDGLENPNNAIIKLKVRIEEEKLEQYKNNLVSVMKQLVEMRIPKVINKLFKKEEDLSDLDPVERVLYIEMKKLFDEWREVIYKGSLQQVI